MDKSTSTLNINIHGSDTFDESPLCTTTNMYARGVVMAGINLAMNDFHPNITKDEGVKEYVESRLGYALKNCKSNIPSIPVFQDRSGYFTENFFGLAFSSDMLDKILANKVISCEEKGMLLAHIRCIDNCILTLANKRAIPIANDEKRISLDTIFNYMIQAMKNLRTKFESSTEYSKLFLLFLKIRSSLNELIDEIYDPKEKLFRLLDKGSVAITVELIESDIKSFTRLQNEILDIEGLSKAVQSKKYPEMIKQMNAANLFEAIVAIFNCITSYINELTLIDLPGYSNLCMSITAFASVASCLIFFAFPKKDLEGHIEVLKRKESADIVPLPDFSLSDFPEEKYFDAPENYVDYVGQKVAAVAPTVVVQEIQPSHRQKHVILLIFIIFAVLGLLLLAIRYLSIWK